MRGMAGALLTLLAIAGAGEPDEKPPFRWLQHYGSSEHDNWREREDEVTWPRVRWRVAEARGEPTFDGETVYSGGPELLAIDPTSGEVRARESAGEGRVFAMAPALIGRLVVVRRSDGLVRAYTRDLSKIVWEHRDEESGQDVRRTGSWREGLYVLAAGSRIRALDVRNGEVEWSFEHPGGQPFHVVPAIDGQRVYAGASDGTFFALDRRSGRCMWQHEQDGAYGFSDPVVAEGVVLAGDRGVRRARKGRLRAFDPRTGGVRWEFDFGATGLSTPGHEPGYALLGYGVWAAALDLKTREPETIRTGTNAFGSPTVVGQTFYFGNLDGHLYAYEAKRGRPLWRFRVPGNATIEVGGGRTRSIPHQVYDFVHTGNAIFVATSNGLYCLVHDPEHGSRRPENALIEATE